MTVKEEYFSSDKQIMKICRRAKGFERRTVYNRNQVRFFMWINKFYYQKQKAGTGSTV